MQVLLVLAAGLLASAAGKNIQYTLSESTHGFDFLPETNYTAVCAKCPDNIPFIDHPFSCRILVTCMRLSGKVSLSECQTDDVMLNAWFSCNRADSHYGIKCTYSETNNPCGLERTPITDGKTCNGYYECDTDTNDGGLRKMECVAGERFDYSAKGCVPDASCTSDGQKSNAPPVRINATCTGIDNELESYLLKEYYVVNNIPEFRSTKVPCPASMAFDEKLVGSEFCCNSHVNIDAGICTPNNLVRAASLDNSWNKALSGHNTAYSKIEGNATIVRNTNTNFNGWAYFDGDSTFYAKKMSNNELRLHWNLTFNFQAGELSGNNVVVGIQPVGKNNDANPRVALIDNSACGIEPTYGCHLVVQALNLGYIECFANEHRVQTEDVDLTRTYTVVFKRDGVTGTMIVTGDKVITRTFTIDTNELIEGRDCSMTIGSGYQQRHFVGFMDNVMFYKTCP